MTKIKMLNRNKIKCKKLKRNEMQENKRNKIKGQPKGENYRRDRKKREKKWIARQHKLNEGEERKALWQLKKTFCVCNCEGLGLYL